MIRADPLKETIKIRVCQNLFFLSVQAGFKKTDILPKKPAFF